MRRLESGGPGEERAVDGVDNRLSTDLATTEESAIEPLDGIFAALDLVKFKVDVTLCVRI